MVKAVSSLRIGGDLWLVGFGYGILLSPLLLISYLLLIIEIKVSKEQQSQYNKTDNGITVEIHLVVNDLEPGMF